MMTQAFYTGISGLKAGQAAIDITSNNIANVSTTGFRAYKSEFANLFEDAIVSDGSALNPSSVGIGTKLQASSMVLEDGAYSLSERSTDMAIEGDGWFGVQGEQGSLFTRAGNFTFDQNSDLISPDGHYVLGTMGGNIDYTNNTLTSVLNEVELGDVGSVETLRFPQTLTYPAVATESVQFYGNIGTDDEVRTMGSEAIDANGEKNHISLSISKSEEELAEGSVWEVIATVTDSSESVVYDTKNATITFDSDGEVVSSTLTSIDNNGTSVSLDLEGIVSTGNIAISASSKSDGSIGGDLVGYDVNRNAEVVATFSNGYQSSVGQIAVFHFQNNQGLERASGANFAESSNSGEAYFKKDANGKNIVGANVMTYRLESSNVAIEEALTELIVLQRSYDANSKSVSTADQMMQKALNMDA